MAHTGPLHIYDDVSIVLGGEAGQGIATTEHILTRVLKLAGYHLFSTQEYMSRIRGGSNSNQIRVSSNPVNCTVDRIDICIPLDSDAVSHLADRLTEDTVILGDRERLKVDREMIDVPLSKIATEVGNAIYANTVAAGLIIGLLGIDPQLMEQYLREYWGDKSSDIQDKNVQAGRRGYDIGRELVDKDTIVVDIVSHAGHGPERPAHDRGRGHGPGRHRRGHATSSPPTRCPLPRRCSSSWPGTGPRSTSSSSRPRTRSPR